MAKVLFRISAFAAASATALGVFAITHAAPARAPAHAHPETAAPAYRLATRNPSSGDDGLAADADAAGDTGRSDRFAPRRYEAAPPPAAMPRDEDPIGDLAASSPPRAASEAPEDQPDAAPFDLPYDQLGPAPAAHRHGPRPHHHRRAVTAPARDAPVRSVPDAPRHRLAPEPPRPAQAVVRPHHLHIVVEPPRRPALSPAPDAGAVNTALPEVQADQRPPVDVETRLQQLTRAAAADMPTARFQLSPDLAAGRDGEAVVTLPAGLLANLEADAEESGLAEPGALSITVTLSGRGYGLVPDGAQTTHITPGQPTVFAWRVSPSGAADRMLTATMTAGLPVDGENRSIPLGVLTAELAPPPVQAPAPISAAPAPAPAPAPVPDLGARMRADLGRFGLPDPSRFRLADLAVPGQPTLDVPGLGEVPSEDVVAAGLVALALLFLRSLMRGSSARAERRRRFESFDDPYFRGGRP